MTKLNPLEFRIYQSLRAFTDLRDSRLLIACSGGVDSVALAQIMARIAPKLKFKIALATVHHGTGELVQGRDLAVSKVRELAKRLRVDFYLLRYRGSGELRSEAELREFRLRALDRVQQAGRFQKTVFAHHADDLLETRLIRLIRGTGPQGLMSMREHENARLRPLLKLRKAELYEYALNEKLSFSEDSSNGDETPLRNWIRHRWLPALEAKRPGSTRAFARSLELLVENWANGPGAHASDVQILMNNRAELSRKQFRQSNIRERRRMIAAYLMSSGITNFGQTHVEEIRKRLEVDRLDFSFRLLGLEWVINAEQIKTRKA